jgi:hypothetical protein
MLLPHKIRQRELQPITIQHSPYQLVPISYIRSLSPLFGVVVLQSRVVPIILQVSYSNEDDDDDPQ